MATLTVQNINRSGLMSSYQPAAVGGDEFPNAGNVYLHVKNGGASPITVTVLTTETVDGLAVSDRPITVGAGGEAKIGPWIKKTYNTPAGNVQVTYSGVTNVTVGAFSFTPVV